jgi:signal transduction histidine kinase
MDQIPPGLFYGGLLYQACRLHMTRQLRPFFCKSACPLMSLISGGLVLFVLLYEITALYGQLLRAILAQRREREARLMTGDAVAAAMAHEIKQPLSAMMTNADTAVLWLDRSMPDIDKAKAALKRMALAREP